MQPVEMTSIKTKTVSERAEGKLDERIQLRLKFIQREAKKVEKRAELIDIKYSTMYYSPSYQEYSAMIIYRIV